MSEVESSIASAVHEWFSGRRTRYDRCLFAETVEVSGSIVEHATERDAVFVPEGSRVRSDALVVPFRGRLVEPGDELIVSGRSIELQDYAASAFIDVLGPTVVRFMDSAGWRAFLEDADSARETGVLPPVLRDPRMQLADRAILLDALSVSRPLALVALADGSLMHGAQGPSLGRVDDPVPYEQPTFRGLALGRVVPIAELEVAIGRRPWLPRLVELADLRHVLPPDRAELRVSGFGGVLVADEGADASPRARDPFLLLADSKAFLADHRTRRQFRLDRTSACIVEIVQTSSTEGVATSRIASALGVPVREAARLCSEALGALGIHFGVATVRAAAPLVEVSA